MNGNNEWQETLIFHLYQANTRPFWWVCWFFMKAFALQNIRVVVGNFTVWYYWKFKVKSNQVWFIQKIFINYARKEMALNEQYQSKLNIIQLINITHRLMNTQLIYYIRLDYVISLSKSYLIWISASALQKGTIRGRILL